MELLAPVGDWSMLVSAVEAGADAVYFGVCGLNMRAAAVNFSVSEVGKVVSYCHEHKVKAYCTVNIIIFEKELELVEGALRELKRAEVEAVICWDLAVVKKASSLGLAVHLSTQASVANSAAALLWKSLGVKRVVLARECSLEDVRKIKEKTGLEVEVFGHGARCVSLSGRCFMSEDLFGKSANRGECLQPCRREWKITDEEGKDLKLENNFVLSPKDLCVLPILDKLMFVDCLKIEGRNRGADYVFKVVSAYRAAISAIKEKKFDEGLVEELMGKVAEVYNKGFSTGYLVDYPHHQRTAVYGSKSKFEKVQLGKVSNFYKEKGVAEFKVESVGFGLGDRLGFIGPTSGYVEVLVKEIKIDAGSVEKAEKGLLVAVKIGGRVREGDKVYLIKERG